MPLRVLVAEDARATADILGLFFQMEGHEVDIAYGGAEAVERAKLRAPDLVIMDIRMPGLDGFEASRSIRSLHPGKRPFIVGMSGYDEPLEEGRVFDSYLAKPSSPADLREIVDRVRLVMADDGGGRSAAP